MIPRYTQDDSVREVRDHHGILVLLDGDAIDHEHGFQLEEPKVRVVCVERRDLESEVWHGTGVGRHGVGVELWLCQGSGTGGRCWSHCPSGCFVGHVGLLSLSVLDHCVGRNRWGRRASNGPLARNACSSPITAFSLYTRGLCMDPSVQGGR